MVALEEEGAGVVDVVVELAAGGLVDEEVVVDFDSVQIDGDFVAHHFGFDGLPFAGFAGNHGGGGFGDVEGAVAVEIGRFFVGVVDDLDFVAAMEVEAASFRGPTACSKTASLRPPAGVERRAHVMGDS